MFRHSLSRLLAGLMVLGSAIGHPAVAAQRDDPPVPAVRFGSVKYSGPGCAPGTASISFKNVQTVFDIAYYHFVAQNDLGEASMMHCALTVPVEFPENWRMRVTDLVIFGRSRLTGGDRGRLTVDIDYLGADLPVRHELVNEVTALGNPRYFSQREKLPTSFSPCGRSVLLRMETSLYLFDEKNDNQSELTLIQQSGGATGQAMEAEFERCAG